jgi:hypothetical protein
LIFNKEYNMGFVLTYLGIGFITVFGWNSGQMVWDKYVEPTAVEQSADNPAKKDTFKK